MCSNSPLQDRQCWLSCVVVGGVRLFSGRGLRTLTHPLSPVSIVPPVCCCWPILEETVRAMTHVINQGMAMYWGTSRWSSMEIMVSWGSGGGAALEEAQQ